MFGDKILHGVGYPTPTAIPDEWACRMFAIPGTAPWLAVFMGLLMWLADEDHWQQLDGGIAPEDAAAVWQQVIDSGYDSAESGVNACAGENTSPYWDDPDATDADGSPADNTYTWSERLEDWAIAAFVASSGVPGAAVEYLTIAPRFRLLFRTRDYGGIARVFLDDELITEVDTYAAADGTTAVDIITDLIA